jgi:hypothetical protein
MRPDSKVTPKLVVAIVEQARIEAAEEAALRFPTSLVVAVLVAGLIGVGWMVRSSWAQDQKPATPAAPRPEASPEPLQPPTEAKPSELLPPEPAAADFSPKTSVPLPTAPPDSPPTIDAAADPEKAAQAFVDQNKKMAMGQLKNLKSEAERLRARLQKVEAGIRRWESLLAAIEKSEAEAKDPGPTSLEPAPPNGRRQLRAKAEPPKAGNTPPTPVESHVSPPRVESDSTPPPPAPR